MTQETEQKLVPVEPTEAMIRVGAWRAKLHRESSPGDTFEETAREVYCTMVAAALSAPSGWRSMEPWRAHNFMTKGPVDGSPDLFDFITADGREHIGQRAPRFWHLVAMWRPHSPDDVNWKAEWEAVCAARIADAAPSPDTGRETCQACGGEIQGWCCQSCDKEFKENDAGRLVFTDDADSDPVSVGDREADFWGCADGNGIDPNLIFLRKGAAEKVAGEMGLTVHPLYTHPSAPDATERMRAAKARLLGYVFETCQPDRGDVFSWIDDRADAVVSVVVAALAEKPADQSAALGEA